MHKKKIFKIFSKLSNNIVNVLKSKQIIIKSCFIIINKLLFNVFEQ